MPGDHGTTLGLDLFELYRAGRQTLPSVAMEFYVACNHVRTSGELVEPSYTRPMPFGGSRGRSRAEWMELNETIARFLSDTADNLDATGTALVLAADAYAETDEAASHELDRLKRADAGG